MKFRCCSLSSSSLLPTLHPNSSVVAQISFFLLQLGQGFSSWLVSCQKHLPNYCFTSRFWVLTPPVPGNYSFMAWCLDFLSVALLSRFSNFLPDWNKMGYLALAVACEMLCSLTEGGTEIPCWVSKENSKPQHSPYLQQARFPHSLANTPAPLNWSSSSTLRMKDSFRSQCFQGEESRAHCPRYVTARGRTGFSSSPSSIFFSVCSWPVAPVLAWGALSWSGPPPSPAFPACILPSPWCDRQSVKHLGLSGGVTLCLESEGDTHLTAWAEGLRTTSTAQPSRCCCMAW